MTNYELMFVIDSSLEEDKRNASIEKVQGIIADANGEVVETDVWGLRKLAYPINKQTDGYYVVLTFKAEPVLPKELDRRLRISDEVIRHIIINKDQQ